MTSAEERVNDVLEQLARELDIPPHKHKLAMERFDSIGRHLANGDYLDATPPPLVYLQGSFRYGTVIRPFKDGQDAGFDLDMVCEINRPKASDSPEDLKEDVGDEVKSYARKNSMSAPEDKRRCWMLSYAPDSDGFDFHVDILPSLPDKVAGALISRENGNRDATELQYTNTTIAITNRNKEVTPHKHEWRSSNPNGYAKWFQNICQPGYGHIDSGRQKDLLFEAYRDREGFSFERAEDISDDLLRMPLQRAIQIMKRHRDVRFSGQLNEKAKPISMIISTLAAQIYKGQAAQLTTTRSALRYIVNLFAEHAALASDQISERMVLNEDTRNMRLIERVADKWYIPNPVNPHYPGDPKDKGENFADRWDADGHAAARAFFQWVAWLTEDLDGLLNSNDMAGMKDTLTTAFGETTTNRVLDRFRLEATGSHTGKMVRAGSTGLARFDVPHREKLRWTPDYRFEATLLGQLHRNGWRTRNLRPDGRSVPKWCPLTFRAQTDAPRPFKVYWQVVNTGRSASDAKDLRGEFIDAQLHKGGLTWTRERTKYTGMHWIECFIVKDCIVVARSGEFVINIE